MTSSLVEHWRELTGVTYPVVHPRDRAVFEAERHSFNLDFPPQAYVGDIENAPVVILSGNGGYDPSETPELFRATIAPSEFLQYLHNPTVSKRNKYADYYKTLNFFDAIMDGQVAIVNAVAYRSPKLSQEKENRRVAEKLPSVHVHQKWLRGELFEQARRGERLVISKRPGHWKIGEREIKNVNGIYCKDFVNRHLSREAKEKMNEFVRPRM